MPDDLYDSDRLSKIAEIMPKFASHAQAGDEIMLGLEGDPSFPSEFQADRPMGTIVKVKETPNGNALKVKMSTGKVVTVHPNSFDPKMVWEFTDDSFQNVLQRSLKQQAEPEPAAIGEAAAAARAAP
jgi:hypothetical protein